MFFQVERLCDGRVLPFHPFEKLCVSEVREGPVSGVLCRLNTGVDQLVPTDLSRLVLVPIFRVRARPAAVAVRATVQGLLLAGNP